MNNSYFNIFTSIAEAALILKIIIFILVVLSIYSWGVIINNFRIIRKNTLLLKKLRQTIKKDKGNLNLLISNQYINKNNPYTPVINFLMNHKANIMVNNTVNQIILENAYNFLYEINYFLEKRNPNLASIGSIAPFIGLLGTVIGIINSFAAIGANSSASLAVIAPGIAEALYATAIGLFVSIPAVFAYNIFTNKMESYKEEQSIFIQEIINILVFNNIESHGINSNLEGRKTSSLDFLQQEKN